MQTLGQKALRNKMGILSEFSSPSWKRVVQLNSKRPKQFQSHLQLMQGVLAPNLNQTVIMCYILLLGTGLVYEFTVYLLAIPHYNKWTCAQIRELRTFIASRYIFFPGLFFIIFSFLAHLWWFGVLGLGSYIGFLGLGFSVDGVWGLWCGAF